MGESKYDVSATPEAQSTAQKKTLRSSQGTSERVQLLRAEYWAQVTGIALKDLVFLDEMGVLLGLMRTHARAAPGDRAYDFKPFYRGAKVSVIGAITVSKVLAVMTLDKSMDAAAFKIYVSQCLVPQLWKGAVVVMDNLTAHKVEAIAPLIEAVGARLLYMPPYSPEFNPIEHWWSQLKAFLRQFSPTTSQKVDMLIKSSNEFNESEPSAKLVCPLLLLSLIRLKTAVNQAL